MRRALVLNLLLVALLEVAAFAGCRLAGINPHGFDLALAGAIGAVAAEVAMIPLLLAQGKDQAAVAQAGLVATVLQMLLAAGMGLAASTLLHRGQPLLNWLLLFYWATLISVCICAVTAVKSAPMHGSAAAASPEL